MTSGDKDRGNWRFAGLVPAPGHTCTLTGGMCGAARGEPRRPLDRLSDGRVGRWCAGWISCHGNLADGNWTRLILVLAGPNDMQSAFQRTEGSPKSTYLLFTGLKRGGN